MQARMTYTDAVEKLGSRDTRKIGNNTYLERRDDETIAIRLHATDVVTFTSGTITLNSGGWRTVTTKARLNYALPVYSEKGTWYVGGYPDHENRVVYYDGISFADDGSLLGETVADPTAEAAAMKKRISAYAALCVKTLAAGMPQPSSGDCWFCLMRTEDGVTLGDTGDHEHLLAHLDENYVVPSLLVNAVSEKGYRHPGIILGANEDGTMGGGSFMADAVRRSVRDYMKRRLLPGETGGRPTAGPNLVQGFAVR